MTFTDSQIRAIETTERVCSVLSILGASFVITTFLIDRAFHKSINRLIFYAAWGNILSNVGTLVSVTGIDLGIDRPLCQLQAFMIQWFVPADAMWAFAMALNVYLTFFRKFDQHQLRSLEWKYVVACYGLTFIPAFILLFIKTESRGKVYGSAVLWCWISIEWDSLRVAGFYGPVWLVIVSTLAIYLAVGKIVFRWRRQLLRFAESNANDYDVSIQSQVVSHGITKTTEIRITSEAANTAEAAHQHDFSSHLPNPARNKYVRRSSEPRSLSTRPSRDTRPLRGNVDANKAAVRYCKCALLFFLALLVTWVPSTVNRVVTLINPKAELYGLSYTSGLVLPLQGFWNAMIYIMTSWAACKALLGRAVTPFIRTQPTRASSANRANPFGAPVGTSNSTGYGSKKQRTADSESLEGLRGS